MAITWSGSITTGTAKTVTVTGVGSSNGTLSYRIGTGSFLGSFPLTKSGSTWTASVTIPHSVFSGTPNEATLAMTFVADVPPSSGVATQSASFTATLASSQVPSISASSWTDQNATVVANIGALVEGNSRVKAAVTAAGILGSTIASSTSTVDGGTIALGGEHLITKSGSIAASVKVTDSRGRTATDPTTLTSLAYTLPAITGLTVQRVTAANVLADDGTSLRVSLVSAVKSLVVSSTEKNSQQIAVHTRQAGSDSWTSHGTWSGALAYNSSFKLAADTFAADKSYILRVTVTDKTGNAAVRDYAVGTAAVTLHLADTGIGVGKIWERGTVDSAGDIYTAGLLVAGPSLRGTTAAMAALAAEGRAYEGLRYFCTTDNREYVRVSGQWRGDTGWVSLSLESGYSFGTGGYAKYQIHRGAFYLVVRDAQRTTGSGVGTMIDLTSILGSGDEIPIPLMTSAASAASHAGWISATGLLRATWVNGTAYRINPPPIPLY